VTTVLNPATEEEIVEIPAANVEDADRVVEAAQRAFPTWRAVAVTRSCRSRPSSRR
jgi:acyl-CoA reductase-like NAD-dependent aldehyde dehydrogenase